MSKSSNNVKRWRKETKQRIVDSLGGKCCICGYNKCNDSLAVHHLDPSKKEMRIAAQIVNPTSWSKIVEELRKCVLLCHNCHSEVHAGISLVPDNSPRFDETYEIYRIEKIMQDQCPICGKDKPIIQFTCSHICAQKKKEIINWDSVNLEELLKSGKSYVAIAELVGLSNVSVRKRAKKLGLI
jgi:hypothetical protein